jgi:hypothetical protein
MKNLVWLIVGIGVGALLASRAARTDRGSAALAGVNGGVAEFVQTVAESYRARQSELTGGA